MPSFTDTPEKDVEKAGWDELLGQHRWIRGEQVSAGEMDWTGFLFGWKSDQVARQEAF